MKRFLNSIQIVAIGVVLAALLGCPNQFTASSGAEDTSEAVAAGESQLNVAMVPISSSLLDGLVSDGGSLSASAFLYATGGWRVTINDSSGTMLAQEDNRDWAREEYEYGWYWQTGPFEGYPEPQWNSFVIPSGDGYTVTAEVFSAEVSWDTPVASGTSASFNAPDGGVASVSVTVFPTNTTALTSGTASSPVTLTPGHVVQNIDTGNEDIYIDEFSPGSEQWYTFTPTGNLTEFQIIPSDTLNPSGAMLNIFNSDGKQLQERAVVGLTPVESNRVFFPTTPDETLYIGLTDFNIERSVDGAAETQVGYGQEVSVQLADASLTGNPVGFYAGNQYNPDGTYLGWDLSAFWNGRSVYADVLGDDDSMGDIDAVRAGDIVAVGSDVYRMSNGVSGAEIFVFDVSSATWWDSPTAYVLPDIEVSSGSFANVFLRSVAVESDGTVHAVVEDNWGNGVTAYWNSGAPSTYTKDIDADTGDTLIAVPQAFYSADSTVYLSSVVFDTSKYNSGDPSAGLLDPTGDAYRPHYRVYTCSGSTRTQVEDMLYFADEVTLDGTNEDPAPNDEVDLQGFVYDAVNGTAYCFGKNSSWDGVSYDWAMQAALYLSAASAPPDAGTYIVPLGDVFDPNSVAESWWGEPRLEMKNPDTAILYQMELIDTNSDPSYENLEWQPVPQPVHIDPSTGSTTDITFATKLPFSRALSTNQGRETQAVGYGVGSDGLMYKIGGWKIARRPAPTGDYTPIQRFIVLWNESGVISETPVNWIDLNNMELTIE